MKACRVLIFPLIFLAPLFLVSAPGPAESASITFCRPIFQVGHDSAGQMRIAIRQYRKDNVPYLLIVNPLSFETSTVKAASFDMSLDALPQVASDTPFVMALDRYSTPPVRLQNHGAVHAEYPVTGMFLTVDMCPSRKPFEKRLFATLDGIAQHSGRAVPVAIAITGNWLVKHRDEFAWLVEQIKGGKLAVTWINHSDTHPYIPHAPLERNFLLTPSIDFEKEVLETERLLLENDITPSPFFRFPGLVADAGLVDKLRKLALIPIGSDAWLAKGEIPKNGSIILVHGNGNEPLGIRLVMRLLKNHGDLRLLPLREAFSRNANDHAGQQDKK